MLFGVPMFMLKVRRVSAPAIEGCTPRNFGPGSLEKISNLTPEQKTKFQELRRKFREENAQLIGAIVAKRLELQSLWTDQRLIPAFSKEKELRDLKNQMRDKVVQMKLEARKFLTPEQIANWKPGWGMGRGELWVVVAT